MRPLDEKDLDALLKGFGAPHLKGERPASEADEEKIWNERADAIAKAAFAAGAGNADEISALIAPPALPAEANEAVVGGEKKMSQENESGGGGGASDKPQPERKRSSLKALAERASQAGARSPSAPGASTPPPASASVTPLPSAPRASLASRPSSPPRPAEAGKDDSGIVDLNVIQKTATPQQIAAAEKAKPASADLFEDDKAEGGEKKATSKKAPALADSPVKAAPAPANQQGGGKGAIIGIAIAAIGLAAAFAITMRDKPKPAQTASTAAVEAKPAETAKPEATAAPTATAVASAPATATASAEPDKPADSATPAKVASNAPAATAKDTPPDDGKVAAAPPAKATAGGKPGDLQSEMAKAVGGDLKEKPKDGTPEPAALPRNQNIPEQPSQGSVQSAIGAVLPGAKACVTGADDVSRATVTFASNGTVQSVSVSGWAAAHGKSGCVQAALKGAKVGPFSKPSFTVGVPIRP